MTSSSYGDLPSLSHEVYVKFTQQSTVSYLLTQNSQLLFLHSYQYVLLCIYICNLNIIVLEVKCDNLGLFSCFYLVVEFNYPCLYVCDRKWVRLKLIPCLEPN